MKVNKYQTQSDEAQKQRMLQRKNHVCTNKKSFSSQEKASRFLATLNLVDQQESYFCDHCRKWHNRTISKTAQVIKRRKKRSEDLQMKQQRKKVFKKKIAPRLNAISGVKPKLSFRGININVVLLYITEIDKSITRRTRRSPHPSRRIRILDLSNTKMKSLSPELKKLLALFPNLEKVIFSDEPHIEEQKIRDLLDFEGEIVLVKQPNVITVENSVDHTDGVSEWKELHLLVGDYVNDDGIVI